MLSKNVFLSDAKGVSVTPTSFKQDAKQLLRQLHKLLQMGVMSHDNVVNEFNALERVFLDHSREPTSTGIRKDTWIQGVKYASSIRRWVKNTCQCQKMFIQVKEQIEQLHHRRVLSIKDMMRSYLCTQRMMWLRIGETVGSTLEAIEGIVSPRFEDENGAVSLPVDSKDDRLCEKANFGSDPQRGVMKGNTSTQSIHHAHEKPPSLNCTDTNVAQSNSSPALTFTLPENLTDVMHQLSALFTWLDFPKPSTESKDGRFDTHNGDQKENGMSSWVASSGSLIVRCGVLEREATLLSPPRQCFCVITKDQFFHCFNMETIEVQDQNAVASKSAHERADTTSSQSSPSPQSQTQSQIQSQTQSQFSVNHEDKSQQVQSKITLIYDIIAHEPEETFDLKFTSIIGPPPIDDSSPACSTSRYSEIKEDESNLLFNPRLSSFFGSKKEESPGYSSSQMCFGLRRVRQTGLLWMLGVQSSETMIFSSKNIGENYEWVNAAKMCGVRPVVEEEVV